MIRLLGRLLGVGVAIFLVVWPLMRSQASGGGPRVMVYTPFPHSTAEMWKEAFEKQTGIHVDQIEEATTQVYSRLRAEKKYPRCDVWIGGGGMVPFIAAANEGLLQPYTPASLQDLPVKRGHLVLRDQDWRWIGVTIIGLGYAYDPKNTSPNDLPDWQQMADPKYRGQFIMYDPAASGTSMLFLEASILKSLRDTGSEDAGWKYLKAIYANMTRYAGDGPPSLMVSRGEVKFGLHFEHQVLQYVEQDPDPDSVHRAMESLQWYLPPDTPVIVDPIAMVHNCPHPEAAKKFIDFIYSPQGQAILHSYFFTINSKQPPAYLNYTLDQMMSHAMDLDVDWMGSHFNSVLLRWQNQIEESHYIWDQWGTP
ncbi:MAG: ABC transporter substrate-binding protein [Candidatus Xenobia bacterium]